MQRRVRFHHIKFAGGANNLTTSTKQKTAALTTTCLLIIQYVQYLCSKIELIVCVIHFPYSLILQQRKATL